MLGSISQHQQISMYKWALLFSNLNSVHLLNYFIIVVRLLVLMGRVAIVMREGSSCTGQVAGQGYQWGLFLLHKGKQVIPTSCNQIISTP